MSQQNREIDDYRFYSIAKQQGQLQFNTISSYEFYDPQTSCRKAHLSPLPNNRNENQPFTDYVFPPDRYKEDAQSKPMGDLRRIYELYDKQFNLFHPDYFKPSDIQLGEDVAAQLPTFLSEFSMIDREYIKTRFISKEMNKGGYYQYFIRRNGEYYVDYIDDFIPVVGVKKLPLWGLNIKEPWKLILMKAWMKEKGGIEGVENAKPYEFIEAFGSTGYKAVSIKKEVDYLRKSKFAESEVAKLESKRTKLNVPGFITAGKTRDIQQVKKMGLRRNRAGYQIIPIESNENNQASALKVSTIISDKTIFKVRSQLPVYWVGQYSVASTNLLSTYNQNFHKLNIEKEFLASYLEISQMFSKFYITPEYSSMYYQGNVIEDSMKVDINSDPEAVCPHYFFEFQVGEKGSINININLPQDSGEHKQGKQGLRYAPIKYFLAKIQKEGDNITQSQYYDGQYVKGYHKSVNRFLQISPGKYIMYVKIQNNLQRNAKFFTININTNSILKNFSQKSLVADVEAKVFKLTFFDYAKAHGLRCYIHKTLKDLVVYICNKFDEIGFSFIALYCHRDAKGCLALRANRTQLRNNKMVICKQAHEAYGDNNEEIKLVAKPSEPTILVLQRTERMKSKNEEFPPLNTIDFYEII